LRTAKPIAFWNLIRENAWFFSGLLLFLIVGAIMLLLIDTGDAIFFFSDRRTPFWDLFFVYGTKAGEAIIYFIALAALLFVRYRYAITLLLMGISVSVVSFAMKALFGHERPSLFFRNTGVFDQLTVIEGVRLNGGANSFPSGHTMSAFALFGFLAFCLPRKRGAGLFFFLMALMVGLSRIYLIQHFLKDVYLGAIVGVLLAMMWYYLAHFPKANWLDGNLRQRRWVEQSVDSEPGQT